MPPVPVLDTGDLIDDTWVDAVAESVNDLYGVAWVNLGPSDFSGGWANVGGANQAVSYRKIGDAVHLRGRMVGGATGTTAFTLPAGFRPPATQTFPAVGGVATPTDAALNITAAGAVSVNFTSPGASIGFALTFWTS